MRLILETWWYLLQILFLYKTWGYYNKFDSTKSMEAYYWYVKIPPCRYMEHGLKDTAFHVQKHIVTLVVCYNFPLVSNIHKGCLHLWDSSIIISHGWVTVTTNRSYHQPRWRRPKTASPNNRGYHQLAAIPTGTITSWYREVGNLELPLQ